MLNALQHIKISRRRDHLASKCISWFSAYPIIPQNQITLLTLRDDDVFWRGDPVVYIVDPDPDPLEIFNHLFRSRRRGLDVQFTNNVGENLERLRAGDGVYPHHGKPVDLVGRPLGQLV